MITNKIENIKFEVSISHVFDPDILDPPRLFLLALEGVSLRCFRGLGIGPPMPSVQCVCCSNSRSRKGKMSGWKTRT